MEPLLTRQEAAKMLKISVRQFDRIVAEGLPVLLIGASVRVRPVDLEAWVAARIAPRR